MASNLKYEWMHTEAREKKCYLTLKWAHLPFLIDLQVAAKQIVRNDS